MSVARRIVIYITNGVIRDILADDTTEVVVSEYNKDGGDDLYSRNVRVDIEEVEEVYAEVPED